MVLTGTIRAASLALLLSLFTAGCAGAKINGVRVNFQKVTLPLLTYSIGTQ